MEEYIDIYDGNREKTGLVLPRKQRLSKDQYMLYVLALVQNTKGELLITKRALTKKWAAGSWEIPGGGAHAGESSLEALQREVEEETGLHVREEDTDLIYSYRNDDAESGDNYFADIYLCKLDFALSMVKIQESEVIDVKTAKLEELHTLYKEDGMLHYQRIIQALTAAGLIK